METWRDAGGIYVISNAITGARYYGSARRLGKRWEEHLRRLRHGEHHNVPLQNAFDGHGESAVQFSPLAILEMDELRVTEQRLLDLVWGRTGCYNVSRDTRSPTRGRKQKPEHTARVAAANRGRKRDPAAVEKSAAWFRGRKLSAEHKAKLSALSKGKKRDPAAVAKSAATQRGKRLSDETKMRIGAGNTGKRRSPETLALMSASHMGLKRSPESIAGTAAAHRGKARTTEERAAISAGMTAEGRRKLSEQKRAYWAAWRAKTLAS